MIFIGYHQFLLASPPPWASKPNQTRKTKPRRPISERGAAQSDKKNKKAKRSSSMSEHAA